MDLDYTDASLVDLGRQALGIEIDGLRAQLPRLGWEFARACRICLNCRGRIVVTGMGKSGHIGGKIAATLASTGTPAFFVHAGEASHGDIGMITRDDAVLALSNSGETDEILTIVPVIKRLGVPLIAFTGNSNSALARIADRALGYRRAGRSLSPQLGAHREHHRRPRRRRCARRDAVESARVYRRGLRALPSGRHVGPALASACQRRDAHRRACAESAAATCRSPRA